MKKYNSFWVIVFLISSYLHSNAILCEIVPDKQDENNNNENDTEKTKRILYPYTNDELLRKEEVHVIPVNSVQACFYLDDTNPFMYASFLIIDHPNEYNIFSNVGNNVFGYFGFNKNNTTYIQFYSNTYLYNVSYKYNKEKETLDIYYKESNFEILEPEEWHHREKKPDPDFINWLQVTGSDLSSIDLPIIFWFNRQGRGIRFLIYNDNISNAKEIFTFTGGGLSPLDAEISDDKLLDAIKKNDLFAIKRMLSFYLKNRVFNETSIKHCRMVLDNINTEVVINDNYYSLPDTLLV